jgi:hypothetical protein
MFGRQSGRGLGFGKSLRGGGLSVRAEIGTGNGKGSKKAGEGEFSIRIDEAGIGGRKKRESAPGAATTPARIAPHATNSGITDDPFRIRGAVPSAFALRGGNSIGPMIREGKKAWRREAPRNQTVFCHLKSLSSEISVP